MKLNYKELVSEEERKKESKSIKEMDKIPIVVEYFPNYNCEMGTIEKTACNKDENILSFFKFPKHINIQYFLQNKEGIFLLQKTNVKLIEIYEKFKDPEDELLYIKAIVENNFEFNFKKTTSELERKETYEKIMATYQNHIPIILEKNPDCIFSKEIQNKYIINNKLTLENFVKRIKKKINFFYDIKIYIQGIILIEDYNVLLSDIYEEFKDERDGLLYITYEIELNKIPIIIQNKPEYELFKINKILLNKNITFSDFKSILKKRNNLNEDIKLEFSINSNQIKNDDIILFDLYEQYKDPDEMLKIDYSIIN